MGIPAWLADNWPNLLGTLFSGSGLWFSGYSTHKETKARRGENILIVTARHAEIWGDFDQHPEYQRVKQLTVDLDREPITIPEEEFSKRVFLHLNANFKAAKLGVLNKPEALSRDVAAFFSYPIPAAVWEKLKDYQDADFVKFVDRCRTGKKSNWRFWLRRVFAESRKPSDNDASTFPVSRHK